MTALELEALLESTGVSAAVSKRYEFGSNVASANATYQPRGDGGANEAALELAQLGDVTNAVSDFEDLAPIPEIRTKPTPVSRNGNNFSGRIVADMVMVDEE